ncbi:unnamed protein product [Polarella glacialis]|uniref:Uncharacterized protein n=1 Tax=Polarella glacialis TaxID=89957 RepID=A0A813L3Y0_POLGL|nr:unnamed protein product [Polarella glacialis]
MMTSENSCPGSSVLANAIVAISMNDSEFLHRAITATGLLSWPVFGEGQLVFDGEALSSDHPQLMKHPYFWPYTLKDLIDLMIHLEGDADQGCLQKMPLPVMMDYQYSALYLESQPFSQPESVQKGRPKLRLLSISGHAAMAQGLFASLEGTLTDYFDFSFRNLAWDKYCSNDPACIQQGEFNWIGEEMREWGFNCKGIWLKVLRTVASHAERLFAQLSSGSFPLLAEVDVFLCSHPSYTCRLFWPLVTRADKPLLGFLASAAVLEMAVPADDLTQWLRDFRDMAAHPRVQFATCSPLFAEKVRQQVGVVIPVTRFFGFHVMARGSSYLPSKLSEVLIWKSNNDWIDNWKDFHKLLDALSVFKEEESKVHLTFKGLRELRSPGEADYSSLASFRATLFLPYEPSLLAFYEFYHLGMPLFVPDPSVASVYMYNGAVAMSSCTDSIVSPTAPSNECGCYLHEDESYAMRIACVRGYSDFYRLPHVQLFSSLAELVEKLHSTGERRLQEISAGMRLESGRASLRAARFWLHALRKVTAGRGAQGL